VTHDVALVGLQIAHELLVVANTAALLVIGVRQHRANGRGSKDGS